MAPVNNVKKNKLFCHDCQKEIKEKEGSLTNGLLLTYRAGDEKLQVYKCQECFEVNPGLDDFRECEVYSRVCGYLRPVAQWNEAKRKEFAQREHYKTPKL